MSTVNYEPQVDPRPLSGHHIVGREINLEWTDGERYVAVVVRYYSRDSTYKLVYPSDDSVEVVCIDELSWSLVPKKLSEDEVMVGAIILFTYPVDNKKYMAMVYDHSDDGEKVKICYLDDLLTDHIGGRGWEFISDSPCAARPELALTSDRDIVYG